MGSLPTTSFVRFRTSEQATTKESPFSLLYGREPRLPSDYDNYNSDYNPSSFICNLHSNWLEAKRRIVKQAEINKKQYDAKYQKEPPNYRVIELNRLKQPATKVGLKKKLRNDLWSKPFKIIRVISPQNVEIALNGNKTKVVNVNNIKKSEKTDRVSDENIRT